MYKRVAILLVEVYEKVEESVIWVCERAQQCQGLTEEFYGFIKSRKRSIFVIDSHLNESAFTSVKREAKLLNRYVKGVPCVNRRCTKGVLFFVKNGILMGIKGVVHRGGPSLYKMLLSTPPPPYRLVCFLCLCKSSPL